MGPNAEKVRLPSFKPNEIYGTEVYLSQDFMSEHSKNTMAGKETGYKLVDLLCACCPETESFKSSVRLKWHYLIVLVASKPVPPSLERQFNKIRVNGFL